MNITQKLSNKKKYFINTFKQKLSINIQKPKAIGISFVFNLSKKVLPKLILILILDKNVIDIVMIGINAYCIANKLKKA